MSESIVILPPKYTKSSLYQDQEISSLHDGVDIFVNVLNYYMPHVRVSRRKRGLFDLCLVFRDSVGVIPDKDFPSQEVDWKNHLGSAELGREDYREACFVSQNGDRFLLRMPLCTASIFTIMPAHFQYQCSHNKP